MSQKPRALLVMVLIVCGVGGLLFLWVRPIAVVGRSLTGVWQEVGSGEILAFSGDGGLKIDDSVGRYRFMDGSHIEIRVPNGSPRLALYSPKTGDIAWTNRQGTVLHYEFRPRLSLQNRVRSASGL